MKLKKQKIAGFSLIELLFAVLFLSVIVVGMMQLHTSSLRLSNTQKNRLNASLYAAEVLEILTSVEFDQVENCNENCYLDEVGNGFILKNNGTESLEEGNFERNIEKTKSLENAYLITSVVLWEDSSGTHETTAKRVVFDQN